VNLNVKVMLIEITGAICGALIIWAYNSTDVDTSRGEMCEQYFEFTAEKKYMLNKMNTLINSNKIEG
jgi:hypothetical protein